MHCTQCGIEGTGSFCGACGATLTPLPCPACSAEMQKGTCFCTTCGARIERPEAQAAGHRVGAVSTAGPASVGGFDTATALPWALTGVLLVALLVVAAFPIFGDGGGTSQPGQSGLQQQAQGTLGAAPNVDLSSMTPGQAADRLYERVARALAAEDETEVMNFLPMALDAYELARPLDTTRLFKYSFLLRVARDDEAALEVAREGLEQDPDNLLHLSSAAEASLAMGAEADARDYYERMLARWDDRLANDPDTYVGWDRLLPVIRAEAEEFLGQG